MTKLETLQSELAAVKNRSQELWGIYLENEKVMIESRDKWYEVKNAERAIEHAIEIQQAVEAQLAQERAT